MRCHGNLVAFANLLITSDRRVASVDLMRHSGDAPTGAMEFLFTELMLQLRARGFSRISLGMAPLSGLSAERGPQGGGAKPADSTQADSDGYQADGYQAGGYQKRSPGRCRLWRLRAGGARDPGRPAHPAGSRATAPSRPGP